MSVEDDDDDASTNPDDIEFWDELLTRLRRRGDDTVRNAFAVGHLRTQGYRPSEIRGRLRLTPRQYNEAVVWISEAMSARHPR